MSEDYVANPELEKAILQLGKEASEFALALGEAILKSVGEYMQKNVPLIQRIEALQKEEKEKRQQGETDPLQ